MPSLEPALASGWSPHRSCRATAPDSTARLSVVPPASSSGARRLPTGSWRHVTIAKCYVPSPGSIGSCRLGSVDRLTPTSVRRARDIPIRRHGLGTLCCPECGDLAAQRTRIADRVSRSREPTSRSVASTSWQCGRPRLLVDHRRSTARCGSEEEVGYAPAIVRRERRCDSPGYVAGN